MKKILFILGVFSFLYGNSQEIKVKEGKDKINGSNNSVLVVTIYENETKTVEKQWKSLMKDYNAKVSSSDEIFADNALIKDISENTVDIYAITKKSDNNVILTVGVDLGGIFLSSDKAKEFKAMEKILKNFATELTKDAIKEQIATAEKEQKKRENTYNYLVKENSNLKKDIEEYKSKIKKAEDAIVTNEKNQEDAKKATEEQTKVLDALNKKLSDVK